MSTATWTLKRITNQRVRCYECSDGRVATINPNAPTLAARGLGPDAKPVSLSAADLVAIERAWFKPTATTNV